MQAPAIGCGSGAGCCPPRRRNWRSFPAWSSSRLPQSPCSQRSARGASSPSAYRRAARIYGALVLAAVLLSLGPRPRLFGWTSPVPGPYALLLLVPGVDGLRVPARLNVIVSLGLVVLGALGAERLTRAASGWRRWAVALRLCRSSWLSRVTRARSPRCACRVPRCQPITPPTVASRAGTRSHAGTAHRRHADAGPLSRATLLHGHRIVNGYSGYGSALQGFVEFPFCRPRTARRGAPDGTGPRPALCRGAPRAVRPGPSIRERADPRLAIREPRVTCRGVREDGDRGGTAGGASRARLRSAVEADSTIRVQASRHPSIRNCFRSSSTATRRRGGPPEADNPGRIGSRCRSTRRATWPP